MVFQVQGLIEQKKLTLDYTCSSQGPVLLKVTNEVNYSLNIGTRNALWRVYHPIGWIKKMECIMTRRGCRKSSCSLKAKLPCSESVSSFSRFSSALDSLIYSENPLMVRFWKSQLNLLIADKNARCGSGATLSGSVWRQMGSLSQSAGSKKIFDPDRVAPDPHLAFLSAINKFNWDFQKRTISGFSLYNRINMI